MSARIKSIGVACLAFVVVVNPAWATVSVWFELENSEVEVGGTTDIAVMACFSDSVSAWGLDVILSDPGKADLVDVQIGQDWDGASGSLDGDGLAGLAFPSGVSGESLLVTLTFEGLVEGVTTLSLSDDAGEDEGFLLEFAGLDADVCYGQGSLTVIPEPAGLVMLGLGALLLVRRSR